MTLFGSTLLLVLIVLSILGLLSGRYRKIRKKESTPEPRQWTFVNFDFDGGDCADGRHEFKSGQWTVNINGTVFTSDGKKA